MKFKIRGQNVLLDLIMFKIAMRRFQYGNFDTSVHRMKNIFLNLPMQHQCHLSQSHV